MASIGGSLSALTCPTEWVPTPVANRQPSRKADQRATRLTHRVPDPGHRSGPGKPANQTAAELGIHLVTLSKWLRQDDIDHGLRPGKPSAESTELRAAHRRRRELGTELAIIRHAAKFPGEDVSGPKGSSTR